MPKSRRARAPRQPESIDAAPRARARCAAGRGRGADKGGRVRRPTPDLGRPVFPAQARAMTLASVLARARGESGGAKGAGRAGCGWGTPREEESPPMGAPLLWVGPGARPGEGPCWRFPASNPGQVNLPVPRRWAGQKPGPLRGVGAGARPSLPAGNARVASLAPSPLPLSLTWLPAPALALGGLRHQLRCRGGSGRGGRGRRAGLAGHGGERAWATGREGRERACESRGRAGRGGGGGERGGGEPAVPAPLFVLFARAHPRACVPSPPLSGPRSWLHA